MGQRYPRYHGVASTQYPRVIKECRRQAATILGEVIRALDEASGFIDAFWGPYVHLWSYLERFLGVFFEVLIGS